MTDLVSGLADVKGTTHKEQIEVALHGLLAYRIYVHLTATTLTTANQAAIKLMTL